MQEEVENRSVNLAITTTRMTARAILSGIRTYLYYHNRNKANEIKDPYKHGKQSVKELIGQGQGVESIEVGDESLRTFNSIAKKYGVDFAIKKDKTVDSPHYVAFFKAKDADALQHILDEYGGRLHVYGTDIPQSVRAAEISAEGRSIFAHDPKAVIFLMDSEVTLCYDGREFTAFELF